MDYRFSDRVSKLKPSAIREIFKYASDPSVISLSAGNPAPDAFPVDAIRKCSEALLREQPVDALQYSVTEGLPALREDVETFLKQHCGIACPGDSILITSGAQQIMDLLGKSVINEGDTVVCEEPSFVGALNSFRSYNAVLKGVPMQEDGMDLSRLEEILKNDRKAKFIYTIPNFQNPTGITTSWEKRKGIYELAKKYGTLVLEDNPYGDLRFAGESIPAIKTLDTDGRVMYSGTFSKTISPGMRVGFAVGGNALIQKMVVCKQGSDVHTNIWSQHVIHRFLHGWDFEEHLKDLQKIYAQKYAVAQKALNEDAPLLQYRPIEGGLFIWCTLPDSIPMMDYVKSAVQHKVCVVPGTAFLTDGTKPCQSFRINYSSPTNENLVRGIAILGKLAADWPKSAD
ncbi:MAG: PLP-dependent aminotransferase family protein [Oscillospiraceae bacterium]|jgi:2-aminoadipate transaminase|nr:PLP-dependent aminotransferase family protein [Oscillospiraceae bacterium]